MSEWIQLSLTVALIVAIAAWAITVQMRRRARERLAQEPTPEGPRMVTVTLEVTADDASEPRVARLVEEAAARIFHAMPSVEVVEIRSISGAVLGRPERTQPVPREVAIPGFLHEPRMKRHTTTVPEAAVPPSPSGRVGAVMSRSGFAAESVARERQPIADRFDLSDDVEARVRDRSDPVDLVRAILEAGGLTPAVQDDVVLVGDRAIVLLPEAAFGTSSATTLNHAFVRFRGSGARSGYAISFGFVDPVEVHRRELFEPSLVHLGADAIQRMADAVALGADPLRFAQAPAVAMPVEQSGGSQMTRGGRR